MNDTQYSTEQPPYESPPQQTQLAPQEIPEIPKPVGLIIGDVSIHWRWFPLPQKKEENT